MKKGKKLWIVSGIVIVAILAVVVAVVTNSGHRVIKVESVEGEVELERESSEKDIFEGMNLRSEDEVTTGEDGLLGLVADDDKYITAIENTCFEIISKGNEKEGKLEIKLKYGTSLFEIENKLPEGVSFEVETPNASISVRGTTFEVTYIPESNTTILVVTEGQVEAQTDTETQMVPAGGTAVITDEHIALATTDSMSGVKIPVFPENSGGNGTGTAGGESDAGQANKVYIQDDEWPELLKGGADKDELEDMLAVVNACQADGNEDYLKLALQMMCYGVYDDGIYQTIERVDGQYIYDIPILNETFSFFAEDEIGEEHLFMDSYIEGDRLVCVNPGNISYALAKWPIDEAYYDEDDEIVVIMQGFITAHLVQDETGKYIFGYIE